MAVSTINAVLAFGVLILASYAHASCDYRTRSQWGARQMANPERYTTASSGVVVRQINETACISVRECYTTVKDVQNYFVYQLSKDIPCTFLIGGSGSAYEGRGWGVKIDSTTKVVMCVIGKFKVRGPSTDQMNGLKKIIACGVTDGKIAKNYKVQAYRKNMDYKLYHEVKKLKNYSA